MIFVVLAALLFLGFLLLGAIHSVGQALQQIANQFTINSVMTYADEDVVGALEKWQDKNDDIARHVAGRRY